MKIICVGRNYAEHAKELMNEIPSEPMLFMKPPTALLKDGNAFYYPDFSKDIHYEAELVLRIAKNGRHIRPEFAAGYYDAVALGLDLTARDLQTKCKQQGHPWEIAKAFDHSAPISDFIPLEKLPDPQSINFQLKKNGDIVQQGNTRDMIFDFDTLICYISGFFKLQIGDYIFTGTPAGVGPIHIGDQLQGFIEGHPVLTCEIR